MAPVSEIMDEDDAVDGVEEDVPGEVPLPPPHGHPGPPGVPLAAAPPHVPELHGEGPLLLRALHVLVQLHLGQVHHVPSHEHQHH